MKTVILCGGYGTRIRDVTDNLPKPLIPIGNAPILWHLMKYYASWTHKEFVLCLGYKSEAIKDFFLNYETHMRDFTIHLGSPNNKIEYHNSPKDLDWNVTMVDTGLDTMTGGRVQRIKSYVEKDDHFFLTYGDGLSDVDLDALLKFHRSHGKILTITGVRPPGRFGEVMANQNHLITEFNEKPQATEGRISGGFFVCRKNIFDYLNDQADLVLEKDPFTRLVQDQQAMLYPHDGFWQPMDTYRDYSYLNTLYAKGHAPWVR